VRLQGLDFQVDIVHIETQRQYVAGHLHDVFYIPIEVFPRQVKRIVFEQATKQLGQTIAQAVKPQDIAIVSFGHIPLW